MSTYMIYVNLYEDIYGDIRRFMSTYTREIASLHYVRLLHDGNSAAAEMGIEAAKTFPIQILMIVFILKQILMIIFILKQILMIILILIQILMIIVLLGFMLILCSYSY